MGITKAKLSKKKSPLLRSEHFDGLSSQLSGKGLCFDRYIGPRERESEVLDIGDTEREREDFLSRLAESRPPSKVTLNPRKPPAKAFAKLLLESARGMRDEHISAGYGLPSMYDERWTRKTIEGEDAEGQGLVAIVYDLAEPAGYASMQVSLSHGTDVRSLFLFFGLNFVYVSQLCRNRGFSIDLSIACGMICRDVLTATYRAVKPGTRITPCVHADYESKGGELFAKHVYSCLESEVEVLQGYGKRRSISLDVPELEAGY